MDAFNNQPYIDIREVNSIDITPGWDKDADKDGLPTDLFLSIDGEYVGCFNYDGTKKSHDQIIKIYTETLHKLLIKGYCSASDFDIEWY